MAKQPGFLEEISAARPAESGRPGGIKTIKDTIAKAWQRHRQIRSLSQNWLHWWYWHSCRNTHDIRQYISNLCCLPSGTLCTLPSQRALHPSFWSTSKAPAAPCKRNVASNRETQVSTLPSCENLGGREYAERVIDHSWPIKHRSEYSVAKPSGFFFLQFCNFWCIVWVWFESPRGALWLGLLACPSRPGRKSLYHGFNWWHSFMRDFIWLHSNQQIQGLSKFVKPWNLPSSIERWVL